MIHLCRLASSGCFCYQDIVYGVSMIMYFHYIPIRMILVGSVRSMCRPYDQTPMADSCPENGVQPGMKLTWKIGRATIVLKPHDLANVKWYVFNKSKSVLSGKSGYWMCYLMWSS
jgi:hypothetical protein